MHVSIVDREITNQNHKLLLQLVSSRLLQGLVNFFLWLSGYVGVLSTWLVAFLRHWSSAAVPVHIYGWLLLIECALITEHKCHLFWSLISRVKECFCPVIPSPNKSKVLSFKEFKVRSLKI